MTSGRSPPGRPVRPSPITPGRPAATPPTSASTAPDTRPSSSCPTSPTTPATSAPNSSPTANSNPPPRPGTTWTARKTALCGSASHPQHETRFEVVLSDAGATFKQLSGPQVEVRHGRSQPVTGRLARRGATADPVPQRRPARTGPAHLRAHPDRETQQPHPDNLRPQPPSTVPFTAIPDAVPPDPAAKRGAQIRSSWPSSAHGCCACGPFIIVGADSSTVDFYGVNRRSLCDRRRWELNRTAVVVAAPAEGGPGCAAGTSLATAGYEPAPRAAGSLSISARIGDGLNPLTMR